MPTQGALEFAFGDTQNSSFTVLSTTNILLSPPNWNVVGTASNIGPNLFEFIGLNPATDLQRYYRIRSP